MEGAAAAVHQRQRSAHHSAAAAISQPGVSSKHRPRRAGGYRGSQLLLSAPLRESVRRKARREAHDCCLGEDAGSTLAPTLLVSLLAPSPTCPPWPLSPPPPIPTPPPQKKPCRHTCFDKEVAASRAGRRRKKEKKKKEKVTRLRSTNQSVSVFARPSPRSANDFYVHRSIPERSDVTGVLPWSREGTRGGAGLLQSKQQA